MGRKPKTNRIPRTRAGNEWTEAAFWGFIRAGLRNMARRWPPVVRGALKRKQRKNQSQNRRLKYEYQCEQCLRWFDRKAVQVDHIVPCGTLKSFSDLSVFAERLFCETDGLRVLCVECHLERKNEE